MPGAQPQSGARIADGVRVLEIGSSAAVAVAGMVLADNGAQVIKLEPPAGDALRAHPAFRMWARGKHSAVADLRERAGRERALALVREADVLLLGLKPPAIERLELEYAQLARDNPRLVYACVSGFGTRGPYREVPAYDALVAARAGRSHEFSTLFGGERPAFVAVPVASHAAAMLALQGVFAALRERERSGRGQRLETSLLAGLSVFDMVHWFPGAPMELRLEDAPFVPYTVGRTADGVWLQFAQNGPELFAAFIRALGLDQPGEQGALATPAAGKAHELRALRARLLDRLRQRSWAQWQEAFASERNVSVEPFLAPGEALQHPQLLATGDSRELDDPEVGRTRQLGPLVEFADTPGRPSGPAPRLGSQGARGWSGAPLPLPAPAARPPTGRILEGVTVLELATWIATPFAGTLLADLGARVIKLEPLAGDPMRGHGRVGFKTVQGKQSLALDLKRPEARAIVHRLVERADALAHNYRPGVPERLGIDYPTLRAINPRLVYLYGASFGSHGPLSWKAAFHVTAGAVCGGPRAQAGAAMPPPPEAQLSDEELARASRYLEICNEGNPDFNAALVAAAALLMGLYARERSGVGQAIETRMMLSNAYVLSKDFIDYAGRPAREQTDAQVLGLGPLYRLYRAREGWVFLAAPSQREFERLCAALGRAELARDVRFVDATSRGRNAHALVEALEPIFAARAADDWERELTARGVGCVRADEGPYARYLYDARWARELGLVTEAADSAIGPYRRFGRTIAFERDMGPLGGAWRAGEHTRAILGELGYSGSEVERLLREGVVGEPAA